MAHLAGSEVRKVTFGQRLQREARTPCAQGKHCTVAGSFQHDLRALRKLSHDLVKHMGGNGGRAPGRSFRRDGIRHFKIEVGRLQAEFPSVSLDQYVCQNRNGVAPLNHAVHVAQRLQKFYTLDCNLH